MDLVNPRPARTRHRACSGASHSARLRRGPSYGPAGPRSIGGEPSLWCAVPAGPSRAWRSCSSPRLARGAFSRESPAAALFSRRALVYSQHRRRARTGRWKAPGFLRSAGGDSAESRYEQALAGAWFCAGESGRRDSGWSHPLMPASWCCGAFVAAHRASSPLA